MLAQTLQTPNLTLVPASAAHVQAELDDREALASLLGAVVPGNWPPGGYDEFTQRFFLARLRALGTDGIGWYGWYAIRRADREAPATLVAIVGYYGPPSPQGVVEIGCSVCPEWRGRGYAVEAVRTLTGHILRETSVTRVLSHAFADDPASVRVLERCGYACLGPGAQPGSLRFAFPGRQQDR